MPATKTATKKPKVSLEVIRKERWTDSLFEVDPKTGKPVKKLLEYAEEDLFPMTITQNDIDNANVCKIEFRKKQAAKAKGKQYKGDPQSCVIWQMFTRYFKRMPGGVFIGVDVTPASVRVELKDKVIVYGTNAVLNKIIHDWDNDIPWSLPAGTEVVLKKARVDNLARHKDIKNEAGGKLTKKRSRRIQGRRIARLRPVGS